MTIPPLVSARWLAAQLGAGHTPARSGKAGEDAAQGGVAPERGAAAPRVFDASWYMPAERRDARAEYRRAHIPGARFFDIDAIADRESSLPHMVPTAAQFERMVSALGICNATPVVFYDQQGMFSAPRAWWLLRLFGHTACAVLDGGLPQWQREGGEIASGEEPVAGEVSAGAPGGFHASLNVRYLRGLGDMLENVRTGHEIVLDARSEERFAGRAPEPRPGVRGGHIPGSCSLPYTRLLSAQRTLLEPAELRARFAACGVDEHSQVITTCGSGLSAAVLSLALEVAGLPPGALYDGSWTEWGSRDDTPVEI
jgi:thiosulfate/3-mercaptopyruvate sulfurtransferase